MTAEKGLSHFLTALKVLNTGKGKHHGLTVFNTEKGVHHFLATLKFFNTEKGLHHFLMTLVVLVLNKDSITSLRILKISILKMTPLHSYDS